MSEPDGERLKALEQRITQAKKRADGDGPRSENHHTQAQIAWRMVTELVAGLGIGLAIGYGLDSLLGTRPFLMVVFVLLGLAAGVKTMMRTAQELQDKHAPDAGQSEED